MLCKSFDHPYLLLAFGVTGVGLYLWSLHWLVQRISTLTIYVVKAEHTHHRLSSYPPPLIFFLLTILRIVLLLLNFFLEDPISSYFTCHRHQKKESNCVFYFASSTLSSVTRGRGAGWSHIREYGKIEKWHHTQHWWKVLVRTSPVSLDMTSIWPNFDLHNSNCLPNLSRIIVWFFYCFFIWVFLKARYLHSGKFQF